MELVRKYFLFSILIYIYKDPTIRDGEGSAAIHTAAQYGFWPICAYLVAKGVDIDSYDTNGLTPLMWAVIRGAGPETIRVLLALGPVFIILTFHFVSTYA